MSRRRLAAARLVVAAACDPAVRLDVHALAERAGLHPWAVRQIIHSPEFESFIRDVTEERVGSILLRGLTRLDRILAEGSPTQAIAAVRVVLRIYQVLHRVVPQQDSRLAELQIAQLLQDLEERRAARGSTPTARDPSSGSLRTPTPASGHHEVERPSSGG